MIFVFFRDEHKKPTVMEIDEFDDSSPNHAANPEAEASNISRERQVGVTFGDDAKHLQHQQLHDELFDHLSDFGMRWLLLHPLKVLY